MIITKTPYRVSLLGGGTDYPAWYTRHGGAVLAATIDKYCWLAVRPTTRFGPRYKIVYARVEETDDLDAIGHPAVRACLRLLDVDRADVHHWGDLPARSGVGSSSAFVVGLLHALHALRGVRPTWGRLADEAIHVERDLLKETVGCQDQIVTAKGGLNVARFDAAGYRIRNVFKPSVARPNANDWLLPHLMLLDTGIQRVASAVAATYVGALDGHAPTLHRLRDMVDEGETILRTGDLRDLGTLLDEAWHLKRSLGDSVSSAIIDSLYERAKRAGALGGKLLGAGGGGHMLLVVPPRRRADVRRELSDLREIPFKFEFDGSRVAFDGGAVPPRGAA